MRVGLLRRLGAGAAATAALLLLLLPAPEAWAQSAAAAATAPVAAGPATVAVSIDLEAEIIDPVRVKPAARLSLRLWGYVWHDATSEPQLVVMETQGGVVLRDVGGVSVDLPLAVKLARRAGQGGVLDVAGDGSRRMRLVADLELTAEGLPAVPMALDATVLVPAEGGRRQPAAVPLRAGIKPALQAIEALRERGDGGELRFRGPLFRLPDPRKPWVAVLRVADVSAAGLKDATAGRAADRLIARLQGAAADYRAAASGEALAALTESAALAEELKLEPALLGALSALRARVEAKAPPAEVHDACRAVLRQIAGAIGSSLSAPSASEIQRAGAIFAERCAACHGAQGDGQGLAAAGMSPPPASFRDPAVAELLSPRRAFHAISGGLPRTAMPAHGALREEERWALAFHALSLRHAAGGAGAGAVEEGERALARAGLASPPLEELALRTDRDLAAWLSARLPPAEVGPALAYLRTAGVARAPSKPAPAARAAPAAPPPPPAPSGFAALVAAVPRPLQVLVSAALAALVLLLARRSVAKVGGPPPSVRMPEPEPARMGLPVWIAIAGVGLALAGGLLTFRFLGERSKAPRPTGPFDLAVRVEGPMPITGGMVILHLEGRQEMAHISDGQARFQGLPAELRGKPVKVAAVTEPELEAAWRADELLPLDPPALTLRMLAERPPFRVVLLYKPAGSTSAQARVLERLGVGADEITVSTLVQRATAAFNAAGARVPAGAALAPLSLKKQRWLDGAISVESLGLDESTIVLVHDALRAAGDEPEDYATVADAALGAP